MATIEDMDRRIAEAKERLAQYEARKRAMLAKEREQARKWRTALLATVGETVLVAAGCDWTRLDLDALRSWLVSHADEAHAQLVGQERTPAQAKAALDDFKATRARKEEENQTEEQNVQPDTTGDGQWHPEESQNQYQQQW